MKVVERALASHFFADLCIDCLLLSCYARIIKEFSQAGLRKSYPQIFGIFFCLPMKRNMASQKEEQLRRYPMRQCLAKAQPSDAEPRYSLARGMNEEGGVRNAKRQRANAVKASSGVLIVILQDRVQAFRHERGQTVGDLLNDAFQHFDVAERRLYELRDTQGAVCPSKYLVESLLEGQAEGLEGPEATLHLIKKTQQVELHQCWQFDPLKDLRKWRVDPAYAAKYETILSDEDGVIRIASTQSVPVTEEHPIGVSASLLKVLTLDLPGQKRPSLLKVKGMCILLIFQSEARCECSAVYKSPYACHTDYMNVDSYLHLFVVVGFETDPSSTPFARKSVLSSQLLAAENSCSF